MQSCPLSGRGILISTPGKVIVEDNYFATAGTPILIEGDTSHWFESGGTEDVLIRNNVFDNCLTSGAETDERWQWGAAVPRGRQEPALRRLRLRS